MDILKQIGYVLLTVGFIFAIYYYSYRTDGELTTAKSCSTSYIQGDYELETLRKQCPGLKKENLIKEIDSYFEKNNSTNIQEKERLKNEVSSSF